MTLMCVDPETCPDCGGPTETVSAAQPALVRHGGYGATRCVVFRYCRACFYILHLETKEVRP